MKTDIITPKALKSYWLFQEWATTQMIDQGITLDELVVQVHPLPTKNSLHEVFKAILMQMYQKDSTTSMTREEMSNCLDVYQDALAMCGVNIYFPDEQKRHLLEMYD